jgi:hypothetical protein
MQHIAKALWLVVAAILVFYSWVWDQFIALGHWLFDLLPWQRFKEALARFIASLPAPAALLLFIIPALVILPFKIAALWLIAHGRVTLGVGTFVAAKFAGVGVAAFIFDAARDKLLSMAWFKRLYDIVIALRDWAHAFIAPYKARIKAFLAPLKLRVKAFLAPLKARLAAPRSVARPRNTPRSKPPCA